MVKRSPSPTPPPITTSAKDTPSPSKKPKTVTLNDGDKAYLMEKAMDLAYKALPFKELSAEVRRDSSAYVSTSLIIAARHPRGTTQRSVQAEPSQLAKGGGTGV